MSGSASLDLRYPIGLLFVVLGLVLLVFGFMTSGNTAMYARTGGLNINVRWGVVMLVTGVLFLVLARRGERRGA